MEKKMIGRIKKSCLMVLVGVMVAGGTVATNVEQTVVVAQEIVQPKADDIDWVFKEVNGKLYRRLYNFTKQEYIGDWILCE